MYIFILAEGLNLFIVVFFFVWNYKVERTAWRIFFVNLACVHFEFFNSFVDMRSEICDPSFS